MGNVVPVFEASYPILLPGVLELHRGGTLRRVRVETAEPVKEDECG